MARQSKKNIGDFDVLGVVQPLLQKPEKPNGETAWILMPFQKFCGERKAKPSVPIDPWFETFAKQDKSKYFQIVGGFKDEFSTQN